MLSLELSTAEGVEVLKLAGRVDVVSAEQLRPVLEERLEGPGPILDFSALDYISSPGLHLLQDAARRLAQRQRPLVAFGLSSLGREIFEAAGVAEVSCCTDLPEALERHRQI